MKKKCGNSGLAMDTAAIQGSAIVSRMTGPARRSSRFRKLKSRSTTAYAAIAAAGNSNPIRPLLRNANPIAAQASRIQKRDSRVRAVLRQEKPEQAQRQAKSDSHIERIDVPDPNIKQAAAENQSRAESGTASE